MGNSEYGSPEPARLDNKQWRVSRSLLPQACISSSSLDHANGIQAAFLRMMGADSQYMATINVHLQLLLVKLCRIS
jgi:hypothetical protein